MRQILRLLHGGNKYDLFLIFASLKLLCTEPFSTGERKETACPKCLGMGTVFSYSCKNCHRCARPLPLAGRWPSMGTTHGLPAAWWSHKRWMRSHHRLPAGKPSGLKAISRLITFFLSVSQPNVCLLVVCKRLRED